MASRESSSPLLSASDQRFTKETSFDEARELQLDCHSRKRVATRIWHITTLFLAAWGIISLCIAVAHLMRQHEASQLLAPDVYRPWTLAHGSANCDCGATIQEAVAKSCVYDELAAAWLPPHCRDHELTVQFSKAGPGKDGAWFYYADAAGTIRINESQIAELGEGSFWVSREWHLSHCVFYWQKYMRMRMTGATMEARFDNIPHIKHCGHLLTKPPPKEHILIEVAVVMNSRATWRKGAMKGLHGDGAGELEGDE